MTQVDWDDAIEGRQCLKILGTWRNAHGEGVECEGLWMESNLWRTGNSAMEVVHSENDLGMTRDSAGACAWGRRAQWSLGIARVTWM